MSDAFQKKVEAAIQEKGYYVAGEALIYLSSESSKDSYQVIPTHQIKNISKYDGYIWINDSKTPISGYHILALTKELYPSSELNIFTLKADIEALNKRVDEFVKPKPVAVVPQADLLSLRESLDH